MKQSLAEIKPFSILIKTSKLKHQKLQNLSASYPEVKWKHLSP